MCQSATFQAFKQLTINDIWLFHYDTVLCNRTLSGSFHYNSSNLDENSNRSNFTFVLFFDILEFFDMSHNAIGFFFYHI